MQVGRKLVLLDIIKHVLEIKKKLFYLLLQINIDGHACWWCNYTTIIKPWAQLDPNFFAFHGNLLPFKKKRHVEFNMTHHRYSDVTASLKATYITLDFEVRQGRHELIQLSCGRGGRHSGLLLRGSFLWCLCLSVQHSQRWGSKIRGMDTQTTFMDTTGRW